MVSNITIALLNIGLGFLFGIYYDGLGVVVAWVFSLVLGSSIVYLSYHINHNIPLIELIPKESRIIIVTCLTGILSAILIRQKFNYNFNIFTLNTIIILLFLIIVIIPFWFHPMRKRLTKWLTEELLPNKAIKA